MNWRNFASGAPELAAIGVERFEAVGLALVGTVRKDGTPRISPVEPPAAQERARCADAYEAQIQWRPSEPYHLFGVNIEQVSYIKSDGEKQRVIRWRPGRAAWTADRRWDGSGYAD